MLFGGTELARRIERAERGFVEECTAALRAAGSDAFVIPVAGVVAAFSGVDSPLTMVVGLGLRPRAARGGARARPRRISARAGRRCRSSSPRWRGPGSRSA